ncbi:MAG: DUF2478 domain-containing protein [Xanthobacteraceae bacterium]|nr:DUF2478 domain-containing protein [Xanthobacteraceae bacterium]
MFEPYAFDSQCDIAALVYGPEEQPDALLNAFAADLTGRGVRVVGLIQGGHRVGRAPQLSAVLVHSGEDVELFQDLGAYAEGCRLDIQALTRAGQEIAAAIDRGADLLVINRFGKQEREGKGLLYLIDRALSADIPVLVAVPDYCFDTWLKFAEGMSVKIPATRGGLEAWWRTVSQRGAGLPALSHPTVCEVFK